MPITLANASSFRLDWHRHAGWGVPTPVQPGALAPGGAPAPGNDAAFMALQAAYRPHGGLVRAEALAACMTAAGKGGYVDLARRIVAGQLFSFHWHHDFWLPLFQLDPGTLALRDGPQRVLDELRDVCDGWTLARWHVQPHAALGGRQPLELIAAGRGDASAPGASSALAGASDHAWAEVLAAARADRARAVALGR